MIKQNLQDQKISKWQIWNSHSNNLTVITDVWLRRRRKRGRRTRRRNGRKEEKEEGINERKGETFQKFRKQTSACVIVNKCPNPWWWATRFSILCRFLSTQVSLYRSSLRITIIPIFPVFFSVDYWWAMQDRVNLTLSFLVANIAVGYLKVSMISHWGKLPSFWCQPEAIATDS